MRSSYLQQLLKTMLIGFLMFLIQINVTYNTDYIVSIHNMMMEFMLRIFNCLEEILRKPSLLIISKRISRDKTQMALKLKHGLMIQMIEN